LPLLKMTMKNNYSTSDILQSIDWMGFQKWIELNAYHKDYQPGKHHFQENLKNKTLPIVWYANTKQAVVNFVMKYWISYMVCIGINERPQILRNKNGYARSAYEREIEVSRNMMMDLDIRSKNVSKEHLAQVELFFKQSDQYFLDQNLQPPTQAFTGRGYHLLFAYPSVKVAEHPTIAQQQKMFTEQFKSSYKRELDNLEVRVDSTFDLRRMTKIYGTAKPSVGVVSTFYGKKRKEDNALKEYLLNLKVSEQNLEHRVVQQNNNLPQLFTALLERDVRLQELWRGEGKTDGSDISRSGFDFSLIKYLLHNGMITDIKILSDILTHRPNGAVQGSGKGEAYIKHTIANAIKS